MSAAVVVVRWLGNKVNAPTDYGTRLYRDVPTVVSTDHHSDKIATTTTHQPLQIHL